MKRRLLHLLLLAALLTAIDAQADEPLDTVLTRLDAQISECLDDATRLDEGLQLIRQALAMKGVEQSALYPVMRFHEGTYYMGVGDVARWKQNRQQLLRMLPFDDYPELSISVPQELGLICRREGQNDSALYYYDLALDEALRQNDVEWLAAISANVGILHYNLSRFSEAEQYLGRGLEYVRQVDDPYTELCILQTYGAAKLALDKADEARPLLGEAYQMACESESPDWQVRCLTTMLKVYNKLGMADSAQFCLDQGSTLLQQLPQQSITSTGFVLSRADYYYDNERWDEAIRDFETLLKQDLRGMKSVAVLERAARCYAQLGRWQQAFCYMDSARIEADTLASERLTAQMAEFSARYQTIEKDLKIARLQTQRLWLVIAAVVVLLALLALWLWWRARRQRREAQMRISTLEAERKRIGKELHDGLCNDMLALEMQLSAATQNRRPSTVADGSAVSPAVTAQNQPPSTVADGSAVSAASPAVFADRLRSLRQQARQLSHQLMPPEFTHLNLNQLLQYHVRTIAANTALRAVYTADPADDSCWQQLPPKVSHEVYRIAQELTANIVKGGTATQLTVVLSQVTAGHYQLSITDNGTPSQLSSAALPGGLGTHTQKDRIVSIGARSNSYVADNQNHFELEFSA